MDTSAPEMADLPPTVVQVDKAAAQNAEDHDEEYEEEDMSHSEGMQEEVEEEEEEDEEASTAATDADAEEDEEGSDDEEEEEEEEEEEQIEVYPLPPLPPVHAPPKVHGIATSEVYSIIKELRRQMDDPVERERARSMLQGDTDVLLAVAQVLQEAHLLRRSTVNDHGEVEEQLVRQPEAPRPSLPTAYNSWIVETPSNPRR